MSSVPQMLNIYEEVQVHLQEILVNTEAHIISICVCG